MRRTEHEEDRSYYSLRTNSSRYLAIVHYVLRGLLACSVYYIVGETVCQGVSKEIVTNIESIAFMEVELIQSITNINLFWKTLTKNAPRIWSDELTDKIYSIRESLVCVDEFETHTIPVDADGSALQH